jgi:hypothetical protein
MPKGQKKAVENTETVENIIDATDIELESKNDEDVIKKLMEQMATLQKQVESQNKEKSDLQKLVEALKSDKSTDIEDIQDSEEIVVISQFVGTLSLFTEGNGMGYEYKFDKFGDIQDIPYRDLKDIVRNNRTFAQNGLFYIANNKVVDRLRLKAYYKRLISNEDMINIFNKKPNEIIEIYKLAPDEEKKTIIDLIIDKKMNKQKVNNDVLVELGELCGKDLINIDVD